MNIEKILNLYINENLSDYEKNTYEKNEKLIEELLKKCEIFSDDFYKISVLVKTKDQVYNLLRLLLWMKYCGNIGHSASGEFDEGKIKFSIDGDGADYIKDIFLEKH